MPTFTTIDDVVAYLYRCDENFRDELTEDEMRDIVNEHAPMRYEDITVDDVDKMLVAAYMATGADEDVAKRLVYR